MGLSFSYVRNQQYVIRHIDALLMYLKQLKRISPTVLNKFYVLASLDSMLSLALLKKRKTSPLRFSLPLFTYPGDTHVNAAAFVWAFVICLLLSQKHKVTRSYSGIVLVLQTHAQRSASAMTFQEIACDESI